MEYQGPMIRGPLYEVTVTEYEAGVQRIDPTDTRVFTRLEDAEAYARSQNTGGPDCYWRATIRKFG